MPETVTLAHFRCLLFFLIATTIISGCGDLSEYENKQVKEALSDSLFNLTESWNIDMEIMEEGQLKLKLTGSYAASIKNETRNITRISGPVYIEIFNENGQPETFVNSDSAVYKPDESIFELFGNVKVKAPGDKRLYSTYLKWEHASDQVSTPESLTIVTPTDSINAIGFYGDSDLSNYTLREVRGETIIN